MSARHPETASERTLLELGGEAVHLLRSASAGTLGVYYLGSVPFALGFLFFWSDMSRSAHAREYCGEAALGLAFLFFWMKSWQAVFAARVRAMLLGSAPPWSVARALRLAACQIILQSTAFLVFPVALALLFLLPWAYAFYQNVTALGDGTPLTLMETVRRSREQALLWKKQNLGVLWLLSPWALLLGAVLAFFALWQSGPDAAAATLALLIPFLIVISPLGLFTAGNAALLILILPELLHKLLGIETRFTLSGASAVLNSTFLTAVLAVSYLVMDPLVKTAYTLRCFYGDTLATGADLRAQLRTMALRNGKTALMAFVAAGLFLSAPGIVRAESAPAGPSPSPAVAPSELNQAISEVLKQREYEWRLPREIPGRKDTPEEQGVVSEFLDSTGKTLLKWKDAVRRLFPRRPPKPKPPSPNMGFLALDTVRIALYALLAVTVAAILWVLVEQFRRSRAGPLLTATAEEVPAKPDITDESATADKLPPDEWLELAKSLLGRGEPRLALRALFLSNLAWLARREWITIARFKSNREYARELQRRAHSRPEAVRTFWADVDTFDAVWYGRLDPDPPMIADFQADLERIRALGE